MFSFAARGLAGNPMGEKAKEALKLQFDKRLSLEFHGARITSDPHRFCEKIAASSMLTTACYPTSSSVSHSIPIL